MSPPDSVPADARPVNHRANDRHAAAAGQAALEFALLRQRSPRAAAAFDEFVHRHRPPAPVIVRDRLYADLGALLEFVEAVLREVEGEGTP